MCGIVGYIGNKDAADIILNGLKRLEYRGYDSAGIALVGEEDLFVHKKNGKISVLNESLDKIKTTDIHQYHTGIGHTRWATHGVPSERNAHPHVDCRNEIAVVHNGIIENYDVIRQMLIGKGHTLRSETDTEVIAHLIEYYYQEHDLLDAVMKAAAKLEGTFGLCIVSKNEPGRIIAVRNGSPLILGAGKNEMILASDVSAIIEHTNKVVYLDDGELVDVKKDNFKIYDLDLNNVEKEIEDVDWDIQSIGKMGFDHFMLKEIFDQPETIQNAFRGRAVRGMSAVRLDGLHGAHARVDYSHYLHLKGLARLQVTALAVFAC